MGMLAPFATFAAVAAMLAVVAFAACYIRTRRAMHVYPTLARERFSQLTGSLLLEDVS